MDSKLKADWIAAAFRQHIPPTNEAIASVLIVAIMGIAVVCLFGIAGDPYASVGQ